GEVPGDYRRPATGALSDGRSPVGVPRGARERHRDRGIQGGGGRPAHLRHGRRDRPDRPEDELAAVRIAILAARQGWHTDELCRALAARGHEGRVLPYEVLVARLGGPATTFAAGETDLGACDAVLARIIPAGSLEQIIFRVDTLHALEEQGVPVRNSPRSIERSAAGWKTNLARGGRARATALSRERTDLALRAARAVGAEYAGVDLLPARDGTDYVVEVNGIPGWRGLQEATSVDVAATIVEHLLGRLTSA